MVINPDRLGLLAQPQRLVRRPERLEYHDAGLLQQRQPQAAVLALHHRAGLVLEVPDAPALIGGSAVIRLNRTCIMAYSAKPVRRAERSAHVGRPGGRSSRSSGP